ncbi:MAG: sigma 54-interacting transcriptional regulator [Klebsiella pneumoniae]|nr:sigma 54-interacting transcriptional regulator [Klebsiella pneumoniae]
MSSDKVQILVVDDDVSHCTILQALLRGWGYQVGLAHNGLQALEQIHQQVFDLVLCDIRMAEMDGIATLKEIKAYNPAIPVLIMTAFSSVGTAVEAIKSGALDYLVKPLDFDTLQQTLVQALAHTRQSESDPSVATDSRWGMIGDSPAMQALLNDITLVAPSDATVLICGESGTGKELVARAIHACSERRDKPLVTLNCAALNESLLESELFGHEKGAFTGATHRNLAEEVSAGRFRQDLYYRLNVVTIEIPPLRRRREDIPQLAQHFLKRYTERNRKTVKGFTPQAMDLLIHYPWPGNIRELENAVERAVVLLTGNYISERELPLAIAGTPLPSVGSEEGGIQPLVEVEKEVILAALEKTGGNKTEAARQLGITRKTLLAKLSR